MFPPSIRAKSRTALAALALGLLCLAPVAPPVHGADLSRQPSQLSVRHWTKADGLPADFIWSLYQSEAGYLWLATDTGIARFDGLNFRVFGVATHEAFRSNDIREITGGRDGTLWAASVGGGLLRLRGDDITRFDQEDGLASDAVYSVIVAANGDVWAGTASGACRLRDDAFKCWTPDDGLVNGRIVRVAEDPQHRIWFASINEGISVLTDDGLRSFDSRNGLADGGNTVLLADPDRNMLVGTLAGAYYEATPDRIARLQGPMPPTELKPFNALRDRDGNTLVSMLGGIWQIDPQLRRLDNPGVAIGYVTDLLEDRDGQLWAATSTGLYQYSAGPFTPFGATEGVADQTFVVASDSDGGIWAGTEAGGLFHVLPDGTVRQFTADDGLPLNAVSSIMVDPQGEIWLGTFGGGLAVMRDQRIERIISTEDGLVGNQIGAIFRDSTGDLWVGTDAGLNRLTDGEVTASLTQSDGLLANQVRDVREDGRGRLLVSGDNGVTIVDLATVEVVDRFDRSRGLDNQTISTTHVDERGVVWIGGRSAGLIRMEGDQWFRFTSEHNVRQTSVMTMVEDQQGHLWLGGRDGITRISRDELDAVARGEQAQVRTRMFSIDDGLRATRVSGGYQSASTRAPDGRLWFATTAGLASVEPDRLGAANTPPAVAIEAVRAGDVVVAPSRDGEYRIPAGIDSLQIDYTVPSINQAGELRFQYRLGDGRWQAANERRTAFFNALPPRGTTFQVAASFDGENFSLDADRAATVSLYVEPLWHQTYAARGLGLAAFLMLLWSGHRLTVRYHKRRQRHLERLVDERTAALQEALSEVRAMSRIDPLTGVANRRHFDERLAETWARAIRHKLSVGVLMIDIDHFKQFNDTAGHQEGDRCLTLVAQALKGALRTEDFMARYGGEEFAVILTGDDVGHMWRIVGRLQGAIRDLALPHPGLPDGKFVTMSAGFATAQPADGDNPEDLLRTADTVLYRAKEQGRDRVVGEPPRGDMSSVASAN